jgi:hypothetical protein
LSDSLSSSFAATLATANARIAPLEAELKASQKAYDAVTAAKAIAKKSQKSALAKAKKADRALADANKEHAQREQAVAERIHTMSSAAKSKFFDLSFCFRLLLRWCTCCHLSLLFFSFCTKFTGVSPSALQTDDDPLMNAVNLLEENWISIQKTFELVSRVLSRLFASLWPKKRVIVLKDNLTELAKSFDTNEDPNLQLKGLSIKRGAEGAIALSLAHGTDFDWERVSTPHGHTRDEMKVFFEKAKKLAPALLMMISPSVASAVPAAPPPVAKDPVPPSTSSEEAAAPPSSTEHNAEVA